MEFRCKRKNAGKPIEGWVKASVIPRDALARFLIDEHRKRRADSAAVGAAARDEEEEDEGEESEDEEEEGEEEEGEEGEGEEGEEGGKGGEDDEENNVKADQKQLSDQKKSESKKGIPNSALSNSKANEEAVGIAQTNPQLARDAARWASVASASVPRADAVALRNRVAQQQTEAKLRASAVQKVAQIRAQLARSLKFYSPTSAAEANCKQSCSIKNGHEEYCVHGVCSTVCDPQQMGHHRDCPYAAAYDELEKFFESNE